MEIGITERGDAALDLDWVEWVGEGKPSILITKDSNKLYEYLNQCFIVDKINIIVHCTITGYGGTIIEPNVPSVPDTIDGYLNLVELLGKERVVLRVDPIFPSIKGETFANSVVTLARAVASTRIRVSFLDNYPHVKTRFMEVGMVPFDYNFHAPLETRKRIFDNLTSKFGEIEVCGEPDFSCTGCISQKDIDTLGVDMIKKNFKQRHSCACLGNKIELLKNRGQCAHKCLYCYWKD
jgi:DNA repair photolyase